MFKKYLKSKMNNGTFWIGLAVIISAIFAPHFVTILLGLFLVLTPDSKMNNLIETWAKHIERKL